MRDERACEVNSLATEVGRRRRKPRSDASITGENVAGCLTELDGLSWGGKWALVMSYTDTVIMYSIRRYSEIHVISHMAAVT